MSAIPQGIILVDKPIGWTSFDAVNRIRHVIAKELDVRPKRVKVGHSGTLDPMATGLLLIAIGGATKKLKYLVGLEKTYIAKATLGATSNTDDAEGDIVLLNHSYIPSQNDIELSMSGFVGNIMQTPPDFSAIKIGGRRAYSVARNSGHKPNLKPRPVRIDSIDVISYEWPVVEFEVAVSSGTYIRSLARDLGKVLEVGAYLSGLRRTSVGCFIVDDAISVKDIDFKVVLGNTVSV